MNIIFYNNNKYFNTKDVAALNDNNECVGCPFG